jgi:mono/diheme cytochrome c family protein
MHGVASWLCLLALVAGSVWAPEAWSAPAQEPVTVMSGVYSLEQADRGRVSYAIYCRTCHGYDLEGGADDTDPAPALKDDGFAQNRGTVGNLFGFIRRTMPRDDPGLLNDVAIAEIVAFLLAENGYPAGTRDLPAELEALERIQIPDRR